MSVVIHEYKTDSLHLGGVNESLVQSTNLLLNVADMRLSCLYLAVFEKESTIEGLKESIKNKIYPMLVPFALNTSKHPMFEVANQKQIEAVLDAIPMEILQQSEQMGLDYYTSSRKVKAAVIAELIAKQLTLFDVTKYEAEFTKRDDKVWLTSLSDGTVELIDEDIQNRKQAVKSEAEMLSKNFYSIPSDNKELSAYFVDRDDERDPSNFMHHIGFKAIVAGHLSNGGFEFASENLNESPMQASRLGKPDYNAKHTLNYVHSAVRLCLHMYSKKYLTYIALPQARELQALLSGTGVVDYYTAGMLWTGMSKASDPLIEIMSKYNCDLAKASKALGVFCRYSAKTLNLKDLPAVI